MYSNPPRHGAAIVTAILSDPELYSQWKVSLHISSAAHACIPTINRALGSHHVSHSLPTFTRSVFANDVVW